MLNLRYPEVIPARPRPSAIITPGQIFAAGRNRALHRARRRRAAGRRSRPATRWTIVNAEGGQARELVALGKDGRSDPGVLGIAAQRQCRRPEGAASVGRGEPRGNSASRSSGAASTSPVPRPSASSARRRLAGTEESFTVQRRRLADHRRARRADVARSAGHGGRR